MRRAVIVSPSDDASRPRGGPVALSGPAEFDRCLARPPLVRSGPFALHLAWRPAAGDVDPSWRLGLVIPKRHEASAVARNTIKRRWRAAFRGGRAAWAVEFGSADVVVRMQSSLLAKAERADPPPARVRARDRFDPQAAFGSLVERLRARRQNAVTAAVAPVAAR